MDEKNKAKGKERQQKHDFQLPLELQPPLPLTREEANHVFFLMSKNGHEVKYAPDLFLIIKAFELFPNVDAWYHARENKRWVDEGLLPAMEYAYFCKNRWQRVRPR